MTTSSPATIHLRPATALAERVLLPGDPGRALALAQALLERPLMFNHNRGLWGYTGTAADGEPLTIQSTGMGGPSAAIVLSELIALGVRRAIRVGTCGALDPSLALGDLLIARESICADGTSRALGARKSIPAEPRLTDALLHSASDARARGVARATCVPRHTHAGTIVSVDLFYEPDPARGVRASTPSALAVEMEAAALFAVGAGASVPVACMLVVSDTFGLDGARCRIDDQSLLASAEAMGAMAVAALSV